VDSATVHATAMEPDRTVRQGRVHCLRALHDSTETRADAGDLSATTALHGIYEVEQFTRNGEPVAPLLTDSTRWRRIAIERSGAAGVWLMNDEQRSFITAADSGQGRLTVAALPADPVRPLWAADRSVDVPRPIDLRRAQAIAGAHAGRRRL